MTYKLLRYSKETEIPMKVWVLVSNQIWYLLGPETTRSELTLMEFPEELIDIVLEAWRACARIIGSLDHDIFWYNVQHLQEEYALKDKPPEVVSALDRLLEGYDVGL